MAILQIHHVSSANDCHKIDLRLMADGQAPFSASAEFTYTFTAQDHEDIRWYLEDFLQNPGEIERTIARSIEGRLVDRGHELFSAVFSSPGAKRLWGRIEEKLEDIRVEVLTGVREASALPWELLRDPQTDAAVALRARSFVRSHAEAARPPYLPIAEDGPPRILVVICRPGKASDVPFRSVASRLQRGLGMEARERFQLDVLRPPTYKRLGEVLRAAKRAGKPYHVVHFDGHGAWLESRKPEDLGRLLSLISSVVLSRPTMHFVSPQRTGKHGYLVFENPDLEGNLQLADGTAVGKLLAETSVPVLVLNACRSAHAEPTERPEIVSKSDGDANEGSPPMDVHSEVRSLGSFAHEVIDAGVAGVVAMRYNVYVVTAAEFVANLYAALAAGQTLGEAASLARKQLADDPLRAISFEPLPLQDWVVPVAYEAAPIAIFSQRESGERLRIHISADAGQHQDPSGLPARPDVGFFGRDETLLALDRAFDEERIVLLHEYAGSGKTTAAAEFGRWYASTGGCAVIIFTSFAQHVSFGRVLDRLGHTFSPALEANNIHWSALDDAQRRNVAIQILGQVSVLWIWDNVELVAGFPSGTASAWSAAEQAELRDFLRDLKERTMAKVLLTSRRDERAWLGELPRRIAVPRMRFTERVQLTQAIASKHSRKLDNIGHWKPLLQFTQGNPLTITVLVGQALRDDLRSAHQIEKFVGQLRAGEAKFDDEISEGRSRSLGASLDYGFAHAFDEAGRRQLAVLHLFQEFVDVNVLRVMGQPGESSVIELSNLTRESGIQLLDRAAEVGLLTSMGQGCYGIHPALPWFFRRLFDEYYPQRMTADVVASRAFVHAMEMLGNYYMMMYESGDRHVISMLTLEESNLLHSRRLARANGWWSGLLGAMQGLRPLYNHTGRLAEWARLVDEIVLDFVDPTDDSPLPGKEAYWSMITEYRVRLARKNRKWVIAEPLQARRVEWDRKDAETALGIPAANLNDTERNAIRTLSGSLHELGQIQRETGNPSCVQSYKEALDYALGIDLHREAATCAYNIGIAYEHVPAIHDLEQADYWYKRSLVLTPEKDALGRSKCMSQLGSVAFARFNEAIKTARPEADALQFLNEAASFYHRALALEPEDAILDRAVDHAQLGLIYSSGGKIDESLAHYRKSIAYDETADNVHGAAITRYNVAVELWQNGRLADALEYARGALRNFESYGGRASADEEKTQKLISVICAELSRQA